MGLSIPLSKRILYEDNHLLIVNKLPGEIVQGDKTGDEPLVETAKKYIKEAYNKPGAVFLGVTHRIDRPVSGIVVFARTSKSLERMNALFQSKEIRKTYWAVVKTKPPHEEETFIRYLIKNEKQNKSYAYKEPRKEAQKSELSYKVLETGDNYTLLEVNPITGRHHQIRCMLADIGSPIKGDLKYHFPRSNPDGSIHLHARQIRFVHPVSGEMINVVADPISQDALWRYFTQSQKEKRQD